jgi:hypothetical protein
VPAAHAGAVRRAVEPPERLHRVGHDAPQRLVVGDVGGDEAGSAPPSRSVAATAAPASALTSQATTLAPIAANSCALARPIPDAAPVTSATLPLRP